MFARLFILGSALATASCASATPEPQYTPATIAMRQGQCAGIDDMRTSWVSPAPPVRIFGNVYDVGTCGITALLITAPTGDVLIDTGMPEAAPMIVANIEALGVKLSDIKWILSTHEHLDHVGATAELRRLTGARTLALAKAKPPLESGEPWPEDPQAGDIPPFAGFPIDQIVADGEPVQLGSLRLTPHASFAHTPGSTSWTWRSCTGTTCRDIAYSDSLSTPAADGYRFSAHPDYVARVRRGFDVVAALPCDILLTPHPFQSDMDRRMADNTLFDPAACRTYAEGARKAFDERLAKEQPGG